MADGKAQTAGTKRPAEVLESDSTEHETAAKKARKSEGPSEQTKDVLSPEELKKLNSRQYLEKTVVPLLLEGLQHLVKQRPNDPCSALADYLRDNNPKKEKQQVQTGD